MAFKSRGAALSLVFALCLSLSLPSSYSAQKISAGASCKGLNKKVDYKKKTYTCIKKGSKLVWSKGVAIKSAAPAATPSPTASPIPSPSPTPIPSVTPSAQPSQAVKIRPNGPQTIPGQLELEKMYKILNVVSQELYARSLNVPKSKSEVLSDEPNNKLVISTKKVVDRTVEMMRAIKSDFPDNKVFLFREFSWLEAKLKPICPNLYTNQIQYGWANAGCERLWSGSLTKYESPGFNYDPLWSAEELLAFSGSHESVHLIQVLSDADGAFKIPAWYREGSANVGAALVMVTMPEYGNGDYGYADNVSRNSWAKPRCGAPFQQWKLKNDAAGHEAMKNCEYDLGRRLVEYIVAKEKTFDNVYKVNQEVRAGMGFDEAFLKHHGMTRIDFLNEVERWLEKLEWERAHSY